MAPTVKHVVADAGAFIRNAPLRDIGETVYTIPDVIAESRDRATRRRFKALPYEIKFKEPSSSALLFVSSFAKKTGDYPSLSSVDLRVIALTYDLEKQFRGTDHINQEPPKTTKWVGAQAYQKDAEVLSKISEGQTVSADKIDDSDPEQLEEDDGFDSSEEPEDEIRDENNSREKIEEESSNIETEIKPKGDESNCDNERSEDAEVLCNEINKVEINSKESTTEEEDSQKNGVVSDEDEDEEEEEEDDDDDDDDEWITPANLASVKLSYGVETVCQEAEICVGCVTTDFAVQNVLIQMGLHVISVDGMRIKQTRSFVLRCFGCMKITKDTSKVFCPHCGNKTLKRLTASINEDGTLKYFLAKNYTVWTRGTKFSLPKPQGGKHARNPILFEDQPQPQQRATKKALQKVDIMSSDIIAGVSPFSTRDVTSRSAQLGVLNHQVPQWAKRNPNVAKQRRRKK